ncbi:hypothetical protein GCM10010524_68570 [Streptomyces mexicanus]
MVSPLSVCAGEDMCRLLLFRWVFSTVGYEVFCHGPRQPAMARVRGRGAPHRIRPVATARPARPARCHSTVSRGNGTTNMPPARTKSVRPAVMSSRKFQANSTQ